MRRTPATSPTVYADHSTMENEAFLQQRDSSESAREDDSVVGPAASFDFKEDVKFFASLFTLKFLVQFVSGVLELPLLRLVERTICRNQLGIMGGDEARCKVPAVQDKLALVMGLKFGFEALPCKSWS